MKKCKYCGEYFVPKRYNQKYCCIEHQKLFYKESNYHKIKSKEHYSNNKDFYKLKHKEYYESHKQETIERGKRNRALRQKNDIDYVLKKRIREQIRDNLKRYNAKKNFHTFELLGYTSEDLHNHLEKLFKKNSDNRGLMSWDNIGEVWHIDHIRPCASFVFYNNDGSINYKAIKECWKLENLQPMYKEDNERKSAWFNDNFYTKGKIISTRQTPQEVVNAQENTIV